MDNDFYNAVQSLGENQNDSSFFQAAQNLRTSTTFPQDVTNAQQQLGSDAYHNLCEKFVEQEAYGKTGLFDSASTAWNSYSQNGQAKPGLKDIKPGDILYWYNPQDSDGHASIYKGENKMISATDNGVSEDNMQDWSKRTGQTPLGFVTP